MFCEKCIHYEVCDLNRRMRGNNNPLMYDKECRLFKDKSLYIELPCKVGDTVYTVVFRSKFIHSAKVVGFHLGKFPTLRGHARKEYLVCYTDYCLRHIDIAQIGKTVFLAREEAEKALEERDRCGSDN